MTNNNTLKILLVLAGLLFMSGVAYLGVEYFNQDTQLTIQGVKISELETELLEVEDDLVNLEILYEDRDKEIKLTNDLLTESYARIKNAEEKIGEYEQTIRRLKREGKLDKTKIKELETILGRLKNNLSNSYKMELDKVYRDNQRLTLLLDTLIAKEQQFRLEYSRQITELTRTKDSLLSKLGENTDKYNMVDVPKVANFNFYNYNSNSNDKNQGIYFKKSQLDVLQVEFDLLENYLAESKIYDLYMIITDPNSFVMSNPVEEYGGSVNIQGVNKVVSQITSINYAKKKKTVRLDYKPSESERWEKGTYNISIIYEGEVLGKDSFYVTD